MYHLVVSITMLFFLISKEYIDFYLDIIIILIISCNS